MCDKNENLFLFFFENEKSIVFVALVVVTGLLLVAIYTLF